MHCPVQRTFYMKFVRIGLATASQHSKGAVPCKVTLDLQAVNDGGRIGGHRTALSTSRAYNISTQRTDYALLRISLRSSVSLQICAHTAVIVHDSCSCPVIRCCVLVQPSAYLSVLIASTAISPAPERTPHDYPTHVITPISNAHGFISWKRMCENQKNVKCLMCKNVQRFKSAIFLSYSGLLM